MTDPKERLAVLETKQEALYQKVDKIENNHLVHIQARLDEVHEDTVQLKAAMEGLEKAFKAAQESRLQGKDKAVVLGSFVTSIGLVIVEIIRSL